MSNFCSHRRDDMEEDDCSVKHIIYPCVLLVTASSTPDAKRVFGKLDHRKSGICTFQ